VVCHQGLGLAVCEGLALHTSNNPAAAAAAAPVKTPALTPSMPPTLPAHLKPNNTEH
jgi:hypothetical protein